MQRSVLDLIYYAAVFLFGCSVLAFCQCVVGDPFKVFRHSYHMCNYNIMGPILLFCMFEAVSLCVYTPFFPFVMDRSQADGVKTFCSFSTVSNMIILLVVICCVKINGTMFLICSQNGDILVPVKGGYCFHFPGSHV